MEFEHTLSESVEHEAEARAVAEVVQDLFAAEVVEGYDNPDKPSLMLVARGKTLVDLTPYEDARRTGPRRRVGALVAHTIATFVAMVLRFRDAGSVVFATLGDGAPRLTAILDYHEVGALGAPRFGGHRVTFAFPLSVEMRAWLAVARVRLGPKALAEFLEDRILDVRELSQMPAGTRELVSQMGLNIGSPSALVAIARELNVRVETKVTAANNLSTGETQVAFEEAHSATAGRQAVTIPGGFVLAIPVLEGGELYPVICRLRYTVRGSEITWSILPYRLDLVMRDVFADVVKEVEAGCGVPVFIGDPES